MSEHPKPDWDHVFIPAKLEYARGKRPDVECVMCAIRDRDKQVKRLVVHETERWLVALNLYPYNPGHLLVFPQRHVADVRDLRTAEFRELETVQRLSLDVLEAVNKPHGFNVGFNLGRAAGASIEHLHLHIVPRYEGELGFMDLLSRTRTIVEDPQRTLRKLRAAFKKRANGL